MVNLRYSYIRLVFVVAILSLLTKSVMKRKILLLAVMILGAVCGVRSETVTQKQAMQIAETFFNAAYGEYTAKPKLAWNGRQLTTDRLFSPFYIYNSPRGGFVIIAADTKAFPILGYSKTTKFERDKLTDAENELLKTYAHEVELIRYDDRQPERAIEAWRNMALYINRMLNNPYDTPEFAELTDDEKDNIEAIDRRNNAVMLPTAVEFKIYNPDRYRDITLDDVTGPTEEEIPFTFYEDFLKEIAQEQATRAAELDEIISPTKPVVSFLGGAHYSIYYPVNIEMTVIYSLEGRRMIEKYYKNQNTVNLDLSSLPQGFYVLLALGENGEVFGYKIYR